MSEHDDEPTNPGGSPVPEPTPRKARDRLRDELADWEPIPGAPQWQNDVDERSARRFALLAEVIADRDAETTQRLDEHEAELADHDVRLAQHDSQLAELEREMVAVRKALQHQAAEVAVELDASHPDTRPAPAPEE